MSIMAEEFISSAIFFVLAKHGTKHKGDGVTKHKGDGVKLSNKSSRSCLQIGAHPQVKPLSQSPVAKKSRANRGMRPKLSAQVERAE